MSLDQAPQVREPNRLLSRIITTVMVMCALAMTGLALYRNFGANPPGTGSQPDREVPNWESLLTDARFVGNRDAPAVLLVFTDLQCPACRMFHEQSVTKLIELYPQRQLAIAFRHWPLDYHPLAMPMAMAAECADRSGRFADFLDAAFKRQDSLGLLLPTQFAERAGVADLASFGTCLSDSTGAERIARDVEAVKELESAGTPTVLLNGKLYGNVPSLKKLRREIDGIIATPKAR